MKTVTPLFAFLIVATVAAAEEKYKFAAFRDVESAIATQDNEIAALRAELASLQSGQVSPAGYVSDGCDLVCCDCSYGGYYGVYENVIVTPFFSRNTAYFLEDPAPLNEGQTEVPFDWEMGYSPRVELGYLNCNSSGFRARYWQYDHDAELNVTGAAGNISVGFGDDSIDEIGIYGASDAYFCHHLKFDVVDLEMMSKECNWLYSAGLRYARMQQTYRGVETMVTAVPDQFFARHDFEGVGLTTAAERCQPLSGCWSAFAKARGSLLYGESNFVAANVPTTAEIIGENHYDLLGIVELQLGVDYRTCLASGSVFFVTVAAEAQYWMNAGTGGPGNNAVYDEGNYQNSNPQDADMGFLGLTIGTGIEF